MTKEQIMQRLHEHCDYIISQGINRERIIGVFLYGSQNYNMDTENSDIDSKVLIVPTIKDAILSKEWFVKIYILPNGEHCEVMDIRQYVASLKKQNINFVEILFTEYFFIFSKYRTIWRNTFTLHKDLYARYNPEYGLLSSLYQAINNIDRQPNRNKAYANGLRLIWFAQAYMDENIPYESCIKPPLAKIYAMAKNQQTEISEKAIENIKQELLVILEYAKQNYKSGITEDNRTKIDKILDDDIIKFISDT